MDVWVAVSKRSLEFDYFLSKFFIFNSVDRGKSKFSWGLIIWRLFKFRIKLSNFLKFVLLLFRFFSGDEIVRSISVEERGLTGWKVQQ